MIINKYFLVSVKYCFIFVLIVIFNNLTPWVFAETNKSHDKQLSIDLDHYLQNIKITPNHQYGSYYSDHGGQSNKWTPKETEALEKATGALMKHHKDDCKNIAMWPSC